MSIFLIIFLFCGFAWVLVNVEKKLTNVINDLNDEINVLKQRAELVDVLQDELDIAHGQIQELREKVKILEESVFPAPPFDPYSN